MRFVAFVLALLSSIWCAHADVTKTNYNGLGFDRGNRVAERDIYGNSLDAHSSHILLSGGIYYLIGEQHGCGFRAGTVGTSCGLSVYTSPDLADGNWTPKGLLIDASVSPWSTRCAAANNNYSGCYRPHMVYNAANNNYILWIQTPQTASAATVALCATPLGPCTLQSDPTHIAHAGVGDFALFIDTGGAAYLIYRFQGTNEIYIDSLNSAYTDSTGSSVDVGGAGEAPQMFSDGTKYYALWGSICAYCDGGSTISYRAASSALGTYGSTTVLNDNSSCGNVGTQPASVDVITAGGHTNYLYRGDNWVGTANEGLASYYWQPLTVSAGAISPFTCAATVTILGVTPAPGASPWPAVDQSNYPSTNGFWQGNVTAACVITNSKWCMQIFVPSTATLAAVGMVLAQNMDAADCQPPAPCSAPDGALEADLYTIDGSNNPQTLLASQTLTVAQLKWAPQFTLLGFNQTVTPGNKYGVVLKPSGTTVTGAIFSVSYDNASDNSTSGSYPSGKFRKSTNGGSTWSDNGTKPQAALFSTFPILLPGPGRVGLFGR